MLATKKPLEQEIDAALQANLTSLREALCDLLAAFVLCLIALFSLAHALLRVTFAGLGLLLWSVALLITFLQWVRAWSVARSKSTLHRK